MINPWSRGDFQLTKGLTHQSFSQANYIRIIGYSLPENDNYVRYLLKSAILGSSNGRSWTFSAWILRATSKRRYDAFVELKFPRYRFCNDDVTTYLTFNRQTHAYRKAEAVDFDTLEEAHEGFFSKHAAR